MKKFFCFCILVSGFAQAQPSIVIGTLSPLSGPLSLAGEQLKLAVQLALDQSKTRFEHLGYELQLSPQDDTANPEVGAAVARRFLANDRMMAVIGGVNSGVTLVASQILSEDHLALIAPATTANAITDRGLSNVSRVAARDTQQGEAAGRYIVGTLKAKTIVLLNDKTAYGAGLCAEVEKYVRSRKVSVLSSEGTEEQSNFAPLVTKLQVLNPDVIYFGGTYPQIGTFLKQLRLAGVSARVMGGHGLDSRGLIDIAGPSAKGVLYTTVSAPKDQLPRASRFFSDYQKAFGKAADSYGALAYDATNVALKAVEQLIRSNQPITRMAVSQNIRSIHMEGITGPLRFDQKGDRVRPRVYVIELNPQLEPVVKAK
ncbi:MAG: branched-chain amino acid ABC transporter substrate-binding protein [Deinococcaceae bacterium]